MRRVAHVEGNYATLVYLPVPATASWCRCADMCLRRLQQLAGSADAQVHLTERAKGPGWHVSLGPLLMLRQQFIEPLLNELCSAVGKAGQHASPVLFDDEVWVLSSRARDRFFAAVLPMEASAVRLSAVARGALAASTALGLEAPAPADEMRLHCSLAWTVADLLPGLLAAGAERFDSAWGSAWRLPCAPPGGGGSSGEPLAGRLKAPGKAVCVRVGERTTSLPLSSVTGGGLLGAYGETDEEDEEEDEPDRQ